MVTLRCSMWMLIKKNSLEGKYVQGTRDDKHQDVGTVSRTCIGA